MAAIRNTSRITSASDIATPEFDLRDYNEVPLLAYFPVPVWNNAAKPGARLGNALRTATERCV